MCDTKIYTIADLHLSLGTEKPMDVFGEMWQNHDMRIADNWRQKVSEKDWVVIPGDISWAMTETEALPDLKFVDELPGNKILMRGNHEFWWSSLAKLNRIKRENNLMTLNFMRNDAMYIPECDIVVCGTRGWRCPGDKDFSTDDKKIYEREVARLELSLKDTDKYGDKRKICFMHFPPFNSKREKSDFTDMMSEYGVSECFYGHIHGILGGVFDEYSDIPLQAEFEKLKCYLISADYIGFNPVRII